MRKVLIIITFIIFVSNTGYAQIKISIDSLEICYVIDSTEIYFIGDSLVINSKKDVVDLYDENLGKGPYIIGYVTIENQSADSLCLPYTNERDSLYYEFNANNKIYKPFIWSYGGLYDPIIIPAGGKYTISVGAWLFLGSDIDKNKGSDYSKEVIEILPTLQFVFDYNNKVYKSCGIRKVTYIDRN